MPYGPSHCSITSEAPGRLDRPSLGEIEFNNRPQGLGERTVSLVLSFSTVEHIIGAKLPPSAKTHREWWWNDRNVTSCTHVQCHAWMKNGYEVQVIDLAGEQVTFRKTGQPTALPESEGPNDRPA